MEKFIAIAAVVLGAIPVVGAAAGTVEAYNPWNCGTVTHALSCRSGIRIAEFYGAWLWHESGHQVLAPTGRAFCSATSPTPVRHPVGTAQPAHW